MRNGLFEHRLALGQHLRGLFPFGVLYDIVEQIEEHQLLVDLDLFNDFQPTSGYFVGRFSVP